MKLYIAGGSRECELAAHYIAAMRVAGAEITLDWVREFRELGLATAPGWEQKHAQMDLDAVRAADVVWLLVPEERSDGASVEFGAALALGKYTVVSGDWRRSIFFHLADARYAAHDSALEHLRNAQVGQ